jgi:hypothetical protein
MNFALTSRERQAVEAVRRFANLRRIESNAAVERCFRGLVDFDEFRVRPSGRADEYHAAGAYADDQAHVQGWLSRIANATKPRRRAAAAEVATEVAPELEASVTTALVFADGRMDVAYEFGSVTAVCAFAVALILDDRRGLTSRLGQCGYCGTFNLDQNPTGRPRRFCSPEHKALFDKDTGAERVKKSRAKKRKARKP